MPIYMAIAWTMWPSQCVCLVGSPAVRHIKSNGIWCRDKSIDKEWKFPIEESFMLIACIHRYITKYINFGWCHCCWRWHCCCRRHRHWRIVFDCIYYVCCQSRSELITHKIMERKYFWRLRMCFVSTTERNEFNRNETPFAVVCRQQSWSRVLPRRHSWYFSLFLILRFSLAISRIWFRSFRPFGSYMHVSFMQTEFIQTPFTRKGHPDAETITYTLAHIA